MSTPRRVLVTGATGLLGRAVLREFAAAGWDAVGCAFSRAAGPILRADLRDPISCSDLIAASRPDVVIHCAAERRPDACEDDPQGAEQINVDAPFHLGRAAARASWGPGAAPTSSSSSSSPSTGRVKAYIFISTDYLFDGTQAPYDERAETCPLNAYGRQKVRGEHAALASHPHAIVLRVPVLYGPTPDLSESAVTAFAAVARDATKAKVVDDWQIRVPTYTPDVGRTLVRMALAATETGPDAAAAAPQLRGGVYNYSAHERFTRYTLTQHFGRLLGVPIDHVTRDPKAPPGAPRPYDCELVTAKLEALGLAAPPTPFDAACREILGLPKEA
jgi:dTDP-4-dehydrorhamnose reductase